MIPAGTPTVLCPQPNPSVSDFPSLPIKDLPIPSKIENNNNNPTPSSTSKDEEGPSRSEKSLTSDDSSAEPTKYQQHNTRSHSARSQKGISSSKDKLKGHSHTHSGTSAAHSRHSHHSKPKSHHHVHAHGNASGHYAERYKSTTGYGLGGGGPRRPTKKAAVKGLIIALVLFLIIGTVLGIVFGLSGGGLDPTIPPTCQKINIRPPTDPLDTVLTGLFCKTCAELAYGGPLPLILDERKRECKDKCCNFFYPIDIIKEGTCVIECAK